jgi:putative SOS response-associated peptidase YedK
MCGRFALTADPSAIQQTFNLDSVTAQMIPRYNIAPTQPVAAIANDDARALTFFRWGLVPSWAKDLSVGSQMINARSETADEKPAFRSALRRRRCLIPANGFYEWPKTSKEKNPVYVHLRDHELFAFAGLWEVWRNADGDELRTCTILTCEPNELIKPLHHRMAVILDPSDYELWLSPDELGPEIVKPLLRPYDADRMAIYEVSKAVNSATNDTAECIVPLNMADQPSLL